MIGKESRKHFGEVFTTAGVFGDIPMWRKSLVISLSMICFALLIHYGNSQPPVKESGKIKIYTPPGWKELNLTLEQKAKITAIQKDFRSKIQTLEKQIKDLKAQEKKEMINVLDEAQKEQLRKLVAGEEKHREKGKEERKEFKEEKKKEKWFPKRITLNPQTKVTSSAGSYFCDQPKALVMDLSLGGD